MYRLYLWDCNETSIFSEDLKIYIYWNQISRKYVQWELSCYMGTDRWTDMTKLIVAFRNFANAPRNGRVKLHPDCDHTHGTLTVSQGQENYSLHIFQCIYSYQRLFLRQGQWVFFGNIFDPKVMQLPSQPFWLSFWTCLMSSWLHWMAVRAFGESSTLPKSLNAGWARRERLNVLMACIKLNEKSGVSGFHVTSERQTNCKLSAHSHCESICWHKWFSKLR